MIVKDLKRMKSERTSILHYLHPATRLVDREFPLGEDLLELIPCDDVEPVVGSLGELDPGRSIDLYGLEPLDLGDVLCHL